VHSTPVSEAETEIGYESSVGVDSTLGSGVGDLRGRKRHREEEANSTRKKARRTRSERAYSKEPCFELEGDSLVGQDALNTITFQKLDWTRKYNRAMLTSSDLLTILKHLDGRLHIITGG
jgi:hypothetical protein